MLHKQVSHHSSGRHGSPARYVQHHIFSLPFCWLLLTFSLLHLCAVPSFLSNRSISSKNNPTTSFSASTPDSISSPRNTTAATKDVTPTASSGEVPPPEDRNGPPAVARKKVNRLSTLFTSSRQQHVEEPAKSTQPRQTQQPPSSQQSSSNSLADAVPKGSPELDPILTYIRNQANKLYQEGYFLRLNDLGNGMSPITNSLARLFSINANSLKDGRPCSDRQWVECFGQLVGTVLSVWNAEALDSGEATPLFINVADASVQMVCASVVYELLFRPF